MAAPIRPAGAKAFQREKWLYVPTVASIAAPTVAEVAAVTGLDLSCFLFDSSARPSQSTNLATRQRRICDGAEYQQIGLTTYGGGEARYSVDPQAAAASDGKKAFEKLTDGLTGFLVRRLGIDVATDLAAGQFVDVFPVEFGPAMPDREGDGESAEVAIVQTFAITGPPAFIKAIVV